MTNSLCTVLQCWMSWLAKWVECEVERVCYGGHHEVVDGHQAKHPQHQVWNLKNDEFRPWKGRIQALKRTYSGHEKDVFRPWKGRIQALKRTYSVLEKDEFRPWKDIFRPWKGRIRQWKGRLRPLKGRVRPWKRTYSSLEKDVFRSWKGRIQAF